MATYVPNAEQLTEPTSSRMVGSAAEEFRVLKTSVDVRTDSLEADVDVLQNQMTAVGLGTDSVALAANLASTASGKGAALVGTESGRTVQDRLDDEKSVFELGGFTAAEIADVRAFTYVNDLSAKMDMALAAAASNGQVLILPYGGYKRTTKLSIPERGRIKGDKSQQYATGFGISPKSTTILFAPAATADAVGLTGTTHGTFRLHNSIEGIHFRADNANARYGFDCDHGIYGRYSDLSFDNFQTAINCNGTINNRFENVMMNGCTTSGVRYAGAVETTDVWDQCTIFDAPIAIQAAGSNVGIRWVNCLFEQIDTYLADLARETQNMHFEACYAEDTCFGGSATSAAFRVGHTGTTLVSQNHLIISGGHYAGRNAGAVGSFIDSEYCTGIILGGLSVARFTNGIKTTMNTVDSSIVSGGWTALSLTNIINHAGSSTDFSKVTGLWPNTIIGGGAGNGQRMRVRQLESQFDIIYGRDLIGPTISLSGAASGTTGRTTLGNGTSTTVGGAGGASALPATPLGYLVAFVGITAVKIPYYTN